MLVPFLIGMVIGGFIVGGVIFAGFVVETKESSYEHHHVVTAVCHRVFALVAENAQLRLSLAAGEMTEDGKKIAAMTMAALDAVIAAEKEAISTGSPSPVTPQEAA